VGVGYPITTAPPSSYYTLTFFKIPYSEKSAAQILLTCLKFFWESEIEKIAA
jgi:hypothetical protein